MFTPKPIGYVHSPYSATSEIPKGLGAKHDVEGELEILPEFEAGLLDIEGFSHLFVIWAFDRSEGYDLTGKPPTDDRPHGVFATRSRHGAPIRSRSVSWNCSAAKAVGCASEASICSTAHPSSTSSPTCRVFPKRSCAEAGWRKQKHAKIKGDTTTCCTPCPRSTFGRCRCAHR